MTPYHINQSEAYEYLIKENLVLINTLIEEIKNKSIPFNPNNVSTYYKNRAKHLQSMALLGLTCEHLVRSIIKNRGYSILEVDYIKKNNNKSKIKYIDKVISFEKSISLFNKSNPDDYFSGLKTYHFNDKNINFEYSYLGYKKIDPKKCLSLIQKIRNNYIHKVEAYQEMNGVIWYVYNYIIWLAQKEFPNQFSGYKLIGNEDIKKLFNNE